MQDYLILREFEDKDFEAVAQIMAIERYKEIPSHEAILCSQSELALHLSNSTYKRVITLKNEVVGVVLVRYEKYKRRS